MKFIERISTVTCYTINRYTFTNLFTLIWYTIPEDEEVSWFQNQESQYKWVS
jgi:hypothetical protein